MNGPLRLTAFSHGAGCGCKLGPDELAGILRHLPLPADPRVLVHAGTRDDAAAILLPGGPALVATTDFFTPVVDDARDWGAIAAANALSDLYAMGAEPLAALSLVAWPRDRLPFDLLGEVLAGATAVAAEAGCPIVGGHSVDAPEPLFGLAAFGTAPPEGLLALTGARAGDRLVLTKPIGTGLVTTALKRDRLTAGDASAAVASMRTLNASAAAVARRHGLAAATDVTGFGLLGHLGNLARASGLAAEVWHHTVPWLPHAQALAEEGVVPGGTARNLAALEGRLTWDGGLDVVAQRLLGDPQTSGGLLLAVPPARLETVIDDLRAAATLAAAEIGVLREGVPGALHVRGTPP